MSLDFGQTVPLLLDDRREFQILGDGEHCLVLVQRLERLLDVLVVAVEDRIVGLAAKDVPGNQRLEVGHNHVTGDVDVVPAGSDPVFGGIVGKHVNQLFVAGRHAQELLVVAHLAEGGMVVAAVGKREPLQQSRIVDLVVISRDAARVAGHEHVGCDASATVDGAAVGCGELLALVHLDTVLIVHFTVQVAFGKFVGVIVDIAPFVVFLDTAAAGGVIACGGQADGTAVGQDKFLLEQALAK